MTTHFLEHATREQLGLLNRMTDYLVAPPGTVLTADSCSYWQGPRDQFGQPFLWFQGKRIDIRRTLFAWDANNGATPAEACFRMTCEDPQCIYSQHMELTTDAKEIHSYRLSTGDIRCADKVTREALTAEVVAIRHALAQGRSPHLIAQSHSLSLAAIKAIAAFLVWDWLDPGPPPSVTHTAETHHERHHKRTPQGLHS